MLSPFRSEDFWALPKAEAKAQKDRSQNLSVPDGDNIFENALSLHRFPNHVLEFVHALVEPR
jgi:hypothetical protein